MAEISRKEQFEMSAKFHCSILNQLQRLVSQASRADEIALVCLKGYGLTPVLGGSFTDPDLQVVDFGSAPVVLYDRSHEGKREYVFDLLLECLSVDEYGDPAPAITTNEVQRYWISERHAAFSGTEALAGGTLSLDDYMEFFDIVHKTSFCAEDTAGAVALLHVDGQVGDVDDYMGSFVDLGSLADRPAQGFLDA